MDHLDKKIRFWILGKKRIIRFRIKDPDLDFSKETRTHVEQFLYDREKWFR